MSKVLRDDVDGFKIDIPTQLLMAASSDVGKDSVESTKLVQRHFMDKY